MERSESCVTDVSNEADAAAGSMLTRVRSLGRLRSPSQPALPPLAEAIVEDAAEPLEIPKLKPSWHLKDKMRTAGVGLVMALNIGTDPPDVTKPHPCAKLQCWFDPSSVSRAKAKEQIGERLQAQYAVWQQQRTTTPLKYRRALDPTVEDVRALCLWLRRKAGNDRVLFHYNGHGVPRPTSSGELWLFDKNHTQYIPLCVTDLRQWLGKPNIVILDCSSAGVLMPFLTAPLESIQSTPPAGDMEAAASHWVSDTIVLCPTSENEWLPMAPEYPADIFTSCLTTPIQMALRWFVRCNPQSMGGLSPEAVDSIPGKAGDRKTPLGELTWIFAAVTDSIAWNVLPRPLFQRLFRQDLLVAGMFRNFLLADRILRSLNCSPQSYPPLPPGVCDHPLWEAWDLACETCLYGLMNNGILTNQIPVSPKTDDEETAEANKPVTVALPAKATNTGSASTVSSPFFSEQLDAFEIWLDFASIHMAAVVGHPDELEPFESPEQLPIVLQVLLTPAYRVRALTLLRRFLDLGPHAVNLALSLGILPYVTKLLQSPEYKQDLMAIWAKILAFDPSCQQTVLKEGGLPHFVTHLTWGINTSSIAIPIDPKEAAAQRTLAAFILSVTCLDLPRAQGESLRLNLHGTCCSLLSSLEFDSKVEMDADTAAKLSIAESRVTIAFRTWIIICLGNLVKENNLVQNQAFGAGVHRRLLARISDDSPDVSAAACYALGCLLGTNRQLSRSSSRHDLQQQQPSANFQTHGGNVPNRLIAPQGTASLQPSTFNPSGIMQLHSTQFSQGQPRLQQPGFNPEIVPSAATPVSRLAPIAFGGRQMDRSFLEQSQAPLISAQFSPSVASDPRHHQQEQSPSVYLDKSRIAYDVSIAEGLLKATQDASAMVRYEAVVSLACLVEKYLAVFMALADRLNMKLDTQKLTSESVSETKEEKLASLLSESMSKGNAILMPEELDDSMVAKFAEIWRILRFLQRHDPYPDVASVANAVVSFVHGHVLKIKLDQVAEDEKEMENGDEDRSNLRSLVSMPSISDQLERDSGIPGQGSNQTEEKITALRRISSVSKSIAPLERANRSQSEGKVLSDELSFILDYDLPESQFYEWQRDLFAERNTDCLNAEEQPIDPLSFNGAVKSYREQRNLRAHEMASKFTSHFASLAPKPPLAKKKQRFNIDLSDEEEDEAAIEAEAKKKRELELKQRNCIKNEGAEMSCILKFHAYEDALCVCDGHDGVSVWDSRKKGWTSTFHNGNPKGTRMTSATWVNEMSSSLFLVGCDDGSVRIWDGPLQPNGRGSKKSPSLSAAFFAAPGMVAGGGSGLVLDWQQYSGRLIAGGSGNQIRCWDLNAEKCASVIETESSECVTTINTAWRYDPYGIGSTTEGYRGLGPDTIVVGHGDGTIKLFDIRVKRHVAEVQKGKGRPSRRPRISKYDGHSSWIVSACLTGYSSRPEVVSGSVDGEIKTWDLRLSSSLRKYTAQRRPMTALSVHPGIPMVATGSHAQFIKVMTLDGDTLQTIRYHEALSGHRIGPVSCLEFHPYKPLLAAGGTDSIVSIYSPKSGAAIL